MPNFEVVFCDGKRIVKSAETADRAKSVARAERRASMPHDTPRSAAEVKIARVAKLDDD